MKLNRVSSNNNAKTKQNRSLFAEDARSKCRREVYAMKHALPQAQAVKSCKCKTQQNAVCLQHEGTERDEAEQASEGRSASGTTLRSSDLLSVVGVRGTGGGGAASAGRGGESGGAVA